MYEMPDRDDAITAAGRETLAVLKTLERIDPANYKPENNAQYPDKSDTANGLKQVACLLKADVGLEVACLDHRGFWDTHVAQGAGTGLLATQLSDLGNALGAFAQDLGDRYFQNTTVVVMTEFGRRVAENTSAGTDHGRASAMFVFGGGVKGGNVYADWPGLKPANLEAPGDLRVTTDYRDALAEILHTRRNVPRETLARIFPRTTDTPRVIGFTTPAST